MAWSSPRTWTTSEVVTAAHMNQEVRDNLDALFPDEVTSASYTPTLEGASSNPTTSDSSGRSYRVGALRHLWARFVVTDVGSGRWFVTLPAAAVGLEHDTAAGRGQIIGVWQARSDIYTFGGNVVLLSASTVCFVRDDLGEGGLALGDSATQPFADGWVSGSQLSFHVSYPVA